VTKKGAKGTEEKKEGEEKKLSNHAERSLAERKKGMRRFNFPRLVTGAWLTKCRCPDAKIDGLLEAQFGAGRLYAAISSRPGQVGRGDGYILEGKELEVGFKLWLLAFCVRLTGGNGNLVLLEEVAVREAEARVANTVHLEYLFHRGGGGALEREKRLSRVSRLVTLC